MDNWLELERRFREFAAREPEAALFASEGDDGTGFRIAYFKSATSERELEAIASVAGKLLHEVGASRCTQESSLDFTIHWWRYLKNTSRGVFRSSHGWSRESPGAEPCLHQTGLIRNLAMASASECVVLHSTHPVREKHRFLKWLHQHYIAAIVVAIITALVLSLLGK